MRFSLVLSALCLVIFCLVVVGCTTAPSTPGPVPPVPTGSLTKPASCGFTNCHGLDLACGTPPQMCTAQYQVSDKCRQFAYCDSSGGTCRLVKTPQFDTCKSCMDKCGGADATEILTCQEKC